MWYPLAGAAALALLVGFIVWLLSRRSRQLGQEEGKPEVDHEMLSDIQDIKSAPLPSDDELINWGGLSDEISARRARSLSKVGKVRDRRQESDDTEW